ncbi:PREDICTED: 12S seed storage protein CRB-like [Tarenaya hassleriana]|uniref:12S seed storage protein CRB-like n=1 Tax=Tarenaya hassleriana TaxID=28532 RepID=UPI00053C106A|nr:PREDICTED: 12S seed storage protein CRB-like [Tarenaya hassleriana]
MGKSSSILGVCLTLLLLVHGYKASEEETNQQKQWQGQWGNECQLDQLNVLEPSHVLKCEAGRIEIWDHHAPQLRCSGVSFDRIVIEPQGLYLPTYFSSPRLSFVVHGRGLMGRVIPGCAETFMDSPVFQGQGQSQGEKFRDMHQKVEHLRCGDTIGNPSGISQWFYNNGNEPLIIVSVSDIGNYQNQLDRNPRPFHLAGNNPQGQVWMRGSQQQPQNNMFSGFDPKILAQAFKIELRIAQQLQNQQDNRGNIVRVKGQFSVIRPPIGRGEEGQQLDNGLEETFCTMRCTDNLDDPSRADVYKPQLGYISTLNSYKLPMLRFLRLSALRGSLRNKAMVLPHWNVNANEVLYVTRGEAHVQVVNDDGKRVFDQQVSKGQLLAIPQGFAVVKTAQSERFEWISFKTDDNANINTLAGRTSLVRGLPLEVLTNGFQISLEEARRVKFNTLETTLTHSSGQFGSGRRSDA